MTLYFCSLVHVYEVTTFVYEKNGGSMEHFDKSWSMRASDNCTSNPIPTCLFHCTVWFPVVLQHGLRKYI